MSMRTMRSSGLPLRWIAAGSCLVCLGACGPKIRLSDDIDTNFDLQRSATYDDELHGPYVAGASFEIYAYDITEDNALDDWTIRSLDEDVIVVEDVEIIRDDLDPNDDRNVKTDILVAHVTTTGPGTGTLEIVNRFDKVVRDAQVSVMQPDRFELRAAGPLFLGSDSGVPSLVDATPKIMAEGEATFLIQWFAGEQVLRGPGALDLQSAHPLVDSLRTLTRHFDEQREWAQLRFDTPADLSELATVDVYANGEFVQTLDFEVVQPDAIAAIELVESGPEGESDLVTVLALALDDAGESIWGVAFDWDIDGRVEASEGDLFRYWYDGSVQSVLGAEFGEARGEATIAGDQGFVDSSNDITDEGGSCFCRAEPERPAGEIAWGLLGLLGLGLVRRSPRAQR